MPSAAPVNVFDDDEDEGWQDMPVVREDEFASGLDEEDQKKYHYKPSAKGTSAANATGNVLDVDGRGTEWRSKIDQNESEYTRLRVNEEDETDEVHLRTKYLFDEDKAMTPLSQMQTTKNLLTEAQRIAYVGLCALTSREMLQTLKAVRRKELKAAVTSMELWSMKIMGRLYYHMELETQEQKMIDSLAQHGVQAMDLAPALMTTHTVANPEYDPAEARRKAADLKTRVPDHPDDDSDEDTKSGQTITVNPQSLSPHPTLKSPSINSPNPITPRSFQTTAKVLGETSTAAIPGVSTSLSTADEKVTLDIRWTVLCDLFLILIADSVFDARSRVLLENVALHLGLGWLDVVKFERRVSEALEIQEDVEKMENEEVIEGRRKLARKKRFMMLGLATLGGGLVIGLSAGLLAPVIGAGLGAAFSTIGISGTAGFLAGTGGAAVITTGGVLTGSGIAARGMVRRTQQVRTFDILPLHNNKRVNCILTVSGFMTGKQDDVRLPFSVLDPIVGDVFSVLWEPDMIRETGTALKILTTEVLAQIGQTVLQATVMTALMSALQWPIILTKLGYLIDNPWNNALDRAKAAGSVLADVLMQRHLGVRPITLIGFSLGARVIFYALLELAKHKAFGIVQDVFILGATLSVSKRSWCETRSAVSGRYVNAFARNDWLLNYLFRATSGGAGTVAGLRPVEDVPGLENVDVTDKIAGHMSYRAFMPLILDQLGFPVSADYFDEPVDPDFEGDRIIMKEEEETKKKGWFPKKKASTIPESKVSQPPGATLRVNVSKTMDAPSKTEDNELPPRADSASGSVTEEKAPLTSSPTAEPTGAVDSNPDLPLRAGFDFNAIKEMLGKAELNPDDLQMPKDNQFDAPPIPPPTNRSESAPGPVHQNPPPDASALQSSLDSPPASGKTVSDSTPASQNDFTSTFSRSMSLNDVQDVENSDFEPQVPAVSPPSFGTLKREPTPPPSLPTLSFADNDGSLWSSSQKGAGLNLSFGASSTSLSAPPYTASPPPLSLNPFAGASRIDHGLSFGAADGSITGAVPPSSDPWIIPNDVGKKKVGDSNVNPWS